ncbi:DUF349 domain-containing protein [Microbacter margulisiae]|uniref:DUF349 domain-containing protein n=1 Tax=Microbacter margulisiae TaxID=1350067 RepID=A0A7W5H1J9_9PORP|nr:DUF349 domain-containing protein [Microbacter margulisiae]MBB3186441.1 hypothetical protein [Microbacter margulisiae]
MDTLDDIKPQSSESTLSYTNSENSDLQQASEEQSVEQIDVNKENESFREFASLTKTALIEKLQEILKNPIEKIDKEEVEGIKQYFYRKHKLEIEQQKKTFVENGGIETDFTPLPDEDELQFKALLQTYKDQKYAYAENIEKTKEDNLKKKLSILEQLKEIAESGDVGESLPIFKKLQQEWKSIGAIPQTKVNELWKIYNGYMERFYDLIKINNELRDYDFKKNLEQKIALCVAAEKLAIEKDVVVASRMLQKLHEEWREIGPVAREFREEVWERFKTASTVVNKKHQEFFAGLKAQEELNLQAKTKLCERVEAIDYSKLISFRDWENKTNEIIELQHQWKGVGFAPRKENIKIYERFRTTCDHFFQQKSEFMKASKAELDANYEKKKVLCEKAESLKDSTDWKNTTDILIQIQKEWKTIGPVAKKYSDALWKRFVSACDHFFEEKAKTFSSKKVEEMGNLNLKQELIDKINALKKTDNVQESFDHLKELLSQWHTIGHVPFKEKDKIFKSFKDAVNKQMDALNIDAVNRKLISFKDTVEKMIEGDHSNQLFREREKLLRTYDTLKSEIATYENNIGFITAKSKKSDTIVTELERKIERLKEERNLIEKKIKLIDENLQ